jgi:hypothetical protein
MKRLTKLGLGLVLMALVFAALPACKKDKEEEKVVNLPSLTTNAITVFTQETANMGGAITNDGGGTITERGVCWSTSVNPTVLDNKQESISTTNDFTVDVTSLRLATTYYVRAYAVNSAGTAYGEDVSFTTDATLALGIIYKGGYIFYLDSTKEHGMVMSLENIAEIVRWGCPTKNIPGATDSKVGAGLKNTAAIVTACSDIGTAADVCNTYVYETYSDWFLPSLGEMELIYNNLMTKSIGNLEIKFYWTSTQDPTNATAVKIVRFNDGGIQNAGKDNQSPVRAARMF